MGLCVCGGGVRGDCYTKNGGLWRQAQVWSLAVSLLLWLWVNYFMSQRFQSFHFKNSDKRRHLLTDPWSSCIIFSSRLLDQSQNEHGHYTPFPLNQLLRYQKYFASFYMDTSCFLTGSVFTYWKHTEWGKGTEYGPVAIIFPNAALSQDLEPKEKRDGQAQTTLPVYSERNGWWLCKTAYQVT